MRIRILDGKIWTRDLAYNNIPDPQPWAPANSFVPPKLPTYQCRSSVRRSMALGINFEKCLYERGMKENLNWWFDEMIIFSACQSGRHYAGFLLYSGLLRSLIQVFLGTEGTGTRFLISKFLITKFLITKFLITKFLSNKVPKLQNS